MRRQAGRLAAALSLAGVMSGCASLATEAPPRLDSVAPSAHTVRYHCTDGSELQVAYLNLEGAESFAAVYYAGRLGVLRAAPTASGARYLPLDNTAGWHWHTKGKRGLLTPMAGRTDGGDTVSECRELR